MGTETQSLLKGIKYQSYKVALDLIEVCIHNEAPSVYFSIELLDDTIARSFENDTIEIGQAKNYGTDFSINSEEIKKALVNFYKDQTIHEDDEMYFHFYTCAGYKNENATGIISAEEVKVFKNNSSCFLEVLSKNEYKLPQYIDIIVNVISKIINLDPNNEIDYDEKKSVVEYLLDHTRWTFGLRNLEELKEICIKKISELKKFTANFYGLEEIIFNSIVQKIEEAPLKGSRISDMISYKDINYILFTLEKNKYRTYDTVSEPLESMWHGDKRNLQKKIQDVCNSYSPKKIEINSRKISRCRIDHKAVMTEHSNSYLLRVFEKCEEVLASMNLEVLEYTEGQIDTVLNKLQESTVAFIKDRQKDFLYAFENEDTAKNSVLLLFDDCYLDFTVSEKKNG